MNESFALRDKSELPLTTIDSILAAFAKSIDAKVLFNYRDYPSRTIYWRVRRKVKYIQIRLNDAHSSFGKEDILYDVFSCSYKTMLPIVTFWNARFDVGRRKCRKVGTLTSPVDPERLSSMLREAFEALEGTAREGTG